MKRLLILAFLAVAVGARASTYVTATVAFTNTAGTTNGQTITCNADTRTFTNVVYVPTTQVKTNNTQNGSAANLLIHLASYPFSGVSVGQTATTNITLKSAANSTITVTLSAGWGAVTYQTNSYGTNIPVIVPWDFLPDASKTNVDDGLIAILNSGKSTTTLNVGGLSGVNALIHLKLTVTNDVDSSTVITGTNVQAKAFVATATGTNQIGYSRFTNVVSGFLYQPTDGPVTNSSDAGSMTNLTGTNVLNWYSIFPSASNTLPLNNGYWLYQASTGFSITNVSGNSAGKASWAILIASNSLATAVTGYVTVPSARAIGLLSTNALVVPAGETAQFKLLTIGTLITNYENAAQQ